MERFVSGTEIEKGDWSIYNFLYFNSFVFPRPFMSSLTNIRALYESPCRKVWNPDPQKNGKSITAEQVVNWCYQEVFGNYAVASWDRETLERKKANNCQYLEIAIRGIPLSLVREALSQRLLRSYPVEPYVRLHEAVQKLKYAVTDNLSKVIKRRRNCKRAVFAVCLCLRFVLPPEICKLLLYAVFVSMDDREWEGA